MSPHLIFSLLTASSLFRTAGIPFTRATGTIGVVYFKAVRKWMFMQSTRYKMYWNGKMSSTALLSSMIFFLTTFGKLKYEMPHFRCQRSSVHPKCINILILFWMTATCCYQTRKEAHRRSQWGTTIQRKTKSVHVTVSDFLLYASEHSVVSMTLLTLLHNWRSEGKLMVTVVTNAKEVPLRPFFFHFTN